MRPPATFFLFLYARQTSSAWRHPPQCLRQARGYSIDVDTPTGPLIKARSIPAQHTGLITALTFASPANRNAISRKFLHELDDAITSLHNQWKSSPGNGLVPRDLSTATRVLILNSEVEGIFCAGADLKERAGMSYEETNQFLTKLRGTLSKLASLPIPTISAISGIALGGGLEVALATTLRVTTSRSTLGLPETRLGIIPGAGGTVRLQNLIGRTKAADLILTGRRVGGREAFAMGVCERLVIQEDEEKEMKKKRKKENREDNKIKKLIADGKEKEIEMREKIWKQGEEDQEALEDAIEKLSPRAPQLRKDVALEEAVRMAEMICQGGPIAIAAAMRIVGQESGNNNSLTELENTMYEKVLNTADRNEALKAFGEKRKPDFVGR